jgi:glycosyltransferase involved in cell wall biosynthesis
MEPSSLTILHTNFHRGWGGQPSRILMLSLGLARKGHRVVIAAPKDSTLSVRAKAAGLETFEEARFLKTSHLASAVRDSVSLKALLHSRAFDLVDAHGSQDLWATAAARWLQASPVPLVFTRHNTKRVADHALNRLLYRRAVDHLIVASAAVLDRYRPFLERGDLDPARISVVHSSFWENRFGDGLDGSSIRRELGADPEDPLVGVIGRLVRDKGGIHFLRAAAQVAREFPAARFLFAGRGTEEESLKRTAADLGISGKVAFLGFREDIPEVTAALDLSVLPSVDCDASSAVLKEAMAAGRPVVATDIGGAAEIVEEGKTGFVVPPGDPEALAAAIVSILRKPDRGREMGTAGRERVRTLFSQERLVAGTLAAYRKTIERARRGTGDADAKR